MNKSVESADVPHKAASLEHNICECVDFMLDKVASGQVLRVLRFSPVSIIPPLFHTNRLIMSSRFLIKDKLLPHGVQSDEALAMVVIVRQ